MALRVVLLLCAAALADTGVAAPNSGQGHNSARAQAHTLALDSPTLLTATSAPPQSERPTWRGVVITVFLAALAIFLYFSFFGPRLEYKIEFPPDLAPGSDAFVDTLEGLAGARLHGHNSVQVLANGENFYEAELEAIREAQHSVTLEAYIFLPSEVTRRFLAALADRARAGVRVHLLMDGLGSLFTRRKHLQSLIEAGGRVAFYHPIRWNTWFRYNNRTHRELLVLDGRVAFVGGAGFDDHWLSGKNGKPRWRDTMCRVEGEAAGALQGTFAENWLEATSEILVGPDYFPARHAAGECAAMVITSAPTAGASTRGRTLFQTVLAAARKSIYICTPYFVPDAGARCELARAARENGVDVRIIVPGKRTDQLLTRGSSRRLYGQLLRAGVRIYEYQPAMMHAKVIVIDGTWSVFGSTNFDNRSFSLNDEVNLAVFDCAVGARVTEDFFRDLEQSRRITLQDWRRRPFYERATEWFGWLLERQQ